MKRFELCNDLILRYIKHTFTLFTHIYGCGIIPVNSIVFIRSGDHDSN